MVFRYICVYCLFRYISVILAILLFLPPKETSSTVFQTVSRKLSPGKFDPWSELEFGLG